MVRLQSRRRRPRRLTLHLLQVPRRVSRIASIRFVCLNRDDRRLGFTCLLKVGWVVRDGVPGGVELDVRGGHVVAVLPGAVGTVGTEEHDEGGDEEAYGDGDDGERS